MGMKPRPHDRAWYRGRIRAVNRKFVKLVKTDPERERLITEKDDLINALIASCAHDRLIGASPGDGPFPLSRVPVRGCLLCGEIEYANEGIWLVLTASHEDVDRTAFTIAIGRVLKDLGINL